MTTSIPNQPNSGDPAEQAPAESASGTAPLNPEQVPAEPGAEFAEQDLSQLAEFADYSNTQARNALTALQQSPNYEHLAAFLNAIREGFLVVDVTGTTTKKRGTRARTLRTAQGQLVLPIFHLNGRAPPRREGWREGKLASRPPQRSRTTCLPRMRSQPWPE